MISDSYCRRHIAKDSLELAQSSFNINSINMKLEMYINVFQREYEFFNQKY